jgi:hypothetical protein
MAHRKIGVAIVLLALIGLPVLIVRRFTETTRQQDARDDELEAKYECAPPTSCNGDFTRDGVRDEVVVLTSNFTRTYLTVVSQGHEILRLPYDHIDGSLRTHTAVVSSGNASRLLIYDGASYSTPLRAAFDWNGERMVEVPASAFENEIINAMAAHDDSGGWNERVFRDLYIKAALTGYYLLLAIVICVVVFRRYGLPRTLRAR